MKTLDEVLRLSIDFLSRKAIPFPRRQAEELLAAVLSMKRIELYMHFDRPMDEGELERCREWLARRAKGEPLEYIIGSVVFFGCQFAVDPAVLIPRPETEILLDKAVRRIKSAPLGGKTAWDICCGSGILGIALKKCLPELNVALSDISSRALEVAKKNSMQNQVEVALYLGNLFAPFQGQKTDILFCNPPYISQSEYDDLDPQVKDFEPKEALLAGKEGTEFYARLSQEMPEYLRPRAKIFFEIGAGQGEMIKNLFHAPWWKSLCVEKDWAGHDRFFFLEFG